MKYDWNIARIREFVAMSVNFSEVLDKLNIPNKGNNTKTLRGILDTNNIDYSHFTGRSRNYKAKDIPLDDYLSNKVGIKAFALKQKLIKAGLKENKCECCGISEWQNKPISCQLHHIDGNPSNNSLENLQVLCPNCHSQTDNYAGKHTEKSATNFCKICGKPIARRSTYCPVCASSNRQKVERPSAQELLHKYKELGSMLQVGKYYGVTDNAVRKWFNSYNIPTDRATLRSMAV